ncbi:MAG TPA: aldolase/citrate lyase family protein, partial [Spirochaetia bacterium]|nr:aldolase/citrate lyase family protein [Spirochaetia bacterium]
MRDNRVKSVLEAGGSAVGTMVVEMRSPAISILLANAGFDYFFLDMEHGSYDPSTTADIIKSARLAGIVPFVRVPDAVNDYIARILDAGAMGIMTPRVETRETVERIVEAVRYPPLGKRGLSIGKGNNDYQNATIREFVDHANANNMV